MFEPTIKYLKAKPQRDKLVDACFAMPPAAWYSSDIKSFNATLAEHRWGYLVQSLQALDDIELPLTAFWDASKLDSVGAGHLNYSARGPCASNVSQHVSSNIAICTSTACLVRSGM